MRVQELGLSSWGIGSNQQQMIVCASDRPKMNTGRQDFGPYLKRLHGSTASPLEPEPKCSLPRAACLRNLNKTREIWAPTLDCFRPVGADPNAYALDCW